MNQESSSRINNALSMHILRKRARQLELQQEQEETTSFLEEFAMVAKGTIEPALFEAQKHLALIGYASVVDTLENSPPLLPLRLGIRLTFFNSDDFFGPFVVTPALTFKCDPQSKKVVMSKDAAKGTRASDTEHLDCTDVDREMIHRVVASVVQAALS